MKDDEIGLIEQHKNYFISTRDPDIIPDSITHERPANGHLVCEVCAEKENKGKQRNPKMALQGDGSYYCERCKSILTIFLNGKGTFGLKLQNLDEGQSQY